MKKYAVIVAGGSGQRMENALPKQFLEISGKPLLWHTINSFLDAFEDLRIILVLPAAHLSTGQELISSFAASGRLTITTGGNNRFISVKNGLKLVPDDAIVFVHDGVRCLVTTALIRRCYDGALINGNAIPAIAPADSIRQQTTDGNKVIDRSTIRLIQTPQTFQSRLLREAFDQEYQPAFSDEATVLETRGHTIHLVEGEATNLKITIPADLIFASKILESRGV